MTDKIILGVDLDEVVYKYIEGLRRRMISNGLFPPEGETAYYSMTASGWFISDEEYFSFHGQQVEEGLYEDLELHEGASETLHDLSESGYRLNIITSRFVNPGQHQRVVAQTVASLDRDQIPYSNISFLAQKVNQYADAYIDDSPGNIASLTAAGRLVIKRNMLYNVDSPGIPAGSWEEIREILRRTFGQ